MATLVQGNHNLLLKLTATSLALTTSVAKLVANHKDKQSEINKDKEFLENYKLAYIENYQHELDLAESFTDLSADVDDLLLELSDFNDK
ncbi:hypothetical protein [Paenibacillus polymyxa]|uniref:hypothetical protein n=1 Tax=Paenibacillus polymyxa TaxID=1406 RepID=UPI0004DEF344|nr:hypothetical protein [Paenibacillus polymyxa]RPE03301.1 hypothetical protein EG487_14775 [Paenibacillus polymyxa]